MVRVVYFYIMQNIPEKIAVVAPEHASYWRTLRLQDYLGGPFADRSGGLITFSAWNLEEANRLVEADPFVKTDLLQNRWVKPWKPE